MSSSSRFRWVAWLALPAAALCAVLLAEGHLAGSVEPTPPPPSEPDALHAWLEAQAAPVAASAAAPGAWAGLAGQPALATWAAVRLDPGSLSPAVARGLAVHAIPPFVLRSLAPDSGLGTEALAVVLAPALAERVSTACPQLDAEVSQALCSNGARRRAEQGRDRALRRALASPDPGRSLWAVELASGLASDGARIAEATWQDAQDDATRGRALIVLARTLPPEEALQLLSRHAVASDPLAPVAALELSRLEGGAAGLGALEQAAGPVRALAEVARARAEGQVPPSGDGLLDRGL